MRPFIKGPMSAMIAWDRLPEIIRPVRVFRTIVLLRIISSTRKIVVGQRGDKLVAKNRFHRREANVILTSAGMMSGMVDGASCYFGLEDRWDRLRLMRQTALHPAELRSIERGHLY